jgi:flagellar basal body-associated protein FliL
MKKIIIVTALFTALYIFLCAGCAGAADWYMFLQNKGWYSFEGESGSTSSAEGSSSSPQSTPQNTTPQTQSGTNTQAQGGNQLVQPSSYIQGSTQGATNTFNK